MGVEERSLAPLCFRRELPVVLRKLCRFYPLHVYVKLGPILHVVSPGPIFIMHAWCYLASSVITYKYGNTWIHKETDKLALIDNFP